MNGRANYFKIGLFVLGSATVLVIAIIALGVGALFREEVMVETYFRDSVQGLDVGSPVKFRGVQIGSVVEMTLVRKEYETEHRYVLVRMALFPESISSGKEDLDRSLVQREVEQGLRVRLGFQGLTGAAYIEADYLDPERYTPLEFDWKPEYPYIPAAPSLITRVSDAVDQIVRNLEKINVAGISKALEKFFNTSNEVLEEADLAEIGRQAEQFMIEIRATNRRLNQILQEVDPKPLMAEARAAVAEMHEMIEETRKPLQSFLQDASAAAENIRRLAGEPESAGDLSRSVENLRQIMDRLDRLVTTRQQDIEIAIENLRDFSENLKEVSEEAKEYPAGIIFGAPPARREPGGR